MKLITMKSRLLPSACFCTFALFLSSSAFAQTPATPAPATETAEQTQDRAASTTPMAAPGVPTLPSTQILPTVDTTSTTAKTLTGSLEAGRTASIIQVQDFDKREELLREVSERVQAVEAAINQMRERADSLDEAGRTALESATRDYEESKARLQESIEQARTAEAGPLWERACLSLASNYAFYVSSVGSMEVALP